MKKIFLFLFVALMVTSTIVSCESSDDSVQTQTDDSDDNLEGDEDDNLDGDSDDNLEGDEDDDLEGDSDDNLEGDEDDNIPSELASITFSGDELPTSYPTDETITLAGVDFTINSVANFSSLYDTSGPIQFKKEVSYIYNATPLVSAESIVITLAPAGTTYNNFEIYAGTEQNPQATAIEGVREGDDVTYTLPAESSYISIYNTSGYAAYAFYITINHYGEGTPDIDTDSDTDTNEEDDLLEDDSADDVVYESAPDDVVAGEAILVTTSDMMSAMGKSEADFVDQRISIVDCTLDCGLTINGDKGTHSSLVPSLWDGSVTDARIYGGNTITFSSEKKILTLVFNSTHNYLTTSHPTYSVENTSHTGTWNGYANEVVFTATEASYIDSMYVTFEADEDDADDSTADRM